MRPIILLVILEVFILNAILIGNPIFASLGKPQISSTEQFSKRPQDSKPPILPTNPTATDAMLNYAVVLQKNTANPPNGISFLDEVERQVLTLTNAERHKRRLTTLQHDAMLQTAARAHSVDMLDRDFFDHVSPEGRTPFDRIAIIHRQLIGAAGENLWEGQGYDVSDAKKLAELAVAGWMNSPGHRENILRKEYTHLGVGGAVKGNIVKLTQNFASTQALFQQPLPLKVKPGDNLALATIAVSQQSAPVKYGFWLSDKGVLAAEPQSINNRQVTIAPGGYRLRLYFVTSRKRNRINYIIYNGPQVVVE
ncbi:MAG: hypothetical protein DRR19_06980 [Candidatus Parabeggiatoa sp. nov. 1]|nr:MAG: hypothetical protein DRR19_06980 [Gammaproteobacteria bacterium]HEC84342.1 CAP domain-containing protein [Thioploca sp.]